MSAVSERTNLRILVIDDNPEIHKDFIKILTKDKSIKTKLSDYEKMIFGETKNQSAGLPEFLIDTASQGEEGIGYVEQALKEGNPYAIAFVDIRMPPGLNGIETIKRIWAQDPDVQIVICTAYSDYSWEDTVSELGQKENLLILKKPFDSVAVRQLACALTKKWQLLKDVRNYTYKLEKEVKDRTASLQESLSLVRATLESSNDGIFVLSNENVLVDYNQRFIDMWQIPEEILINKDKNELRNYMINQLNNPSTLLRYINEPYANLDLVKLDLLYLKDGKIFEFYTQPQKVNQKTVGRVFDFRDITKRIKLEKKLEYQATHDALTGLPNRVMLRERIKQAIRISEQNKTFFALLFLDVDRFKIINDSLNHAAGDEVLRLTANRLESVLRAEDTLARIGGDEFVLVFPDLESETEIINRLRSLRNLFQESIMVDKRKIIINVSIGISVYPKDGSSADILLRNADAAMYSAKEQGGNNFQFYTHELNVKSLAKLEQEMQLRQALVKKEFFLCYQPQVDIRNGKIVAVEALLRWQHPTKGVLLPLDFIQLAEETGLIIPIGEWVLREVCTQSKAWQDSGLPPVRIAVNVTAHQFLHQDLVGLVGKILKETGLEPQYLELELTENVIISHPDIIKAVSELKKLGLIISIDDFGTGYSSLSYLKKIPLDRLKIDGSFVQQIRSDQDDEVIIRAVISMAKNLNLEVVAEGVETQNQLNFLKSNECADIQGFFFSEPLTSQELKEVLKNPSQISSQTKQSN